jgi:DNA-binding NarL/FixJ family response regulator
MPEIIRIGLLDTDEDVRFGRKLLFASLPETDVVFDSDGTSADLESIQDSLIDVLIINQKLASGPGVDFYERLRQLSGNKQTPPAIVTAAYVQPALLLEALQVGVFDVVAIEQGATALVEAVKSASANSNNYSLAELYKLSSSEPRIRAVDLKLVSLVDQLPEKLASNLRRLKSLWAKADLAKLEQYDLSSLKEIVARLPVATAPELVLALNRSGLLDE